MDTIFSTIQDQTITEFTDSSAEDIYYAKAFWKSINAPSIVESKLNPKDSNQHLKVASSSNSMFFL